MERRTDRHEIKYTVSAYETQLLKHRLPALLRRDKHAGAKGCYLIRSVYFDDVDYSAYNEKIAGVKERTKYRIRYYDLDDSVIFFERKSKNGDMTGKDSVKITREQADALLDGTSVVKEPELVRRKIGFLTSELKLEEFFTPDYLFDFFSEVHGVPHDVRTERKKDLFTPIILYA